MEKKKQLITGIIMLIIPIIFLVATKFKKDDLFLIPYIAITAMVICGIITIIKALKIKPQEPSSENTGTISNKEVLFATIFLLVGIVCMRYIGFYVTIFVMLFLLHAYIRKRNSTPAYLKSFLFAFVAWAIVYLVFGLILDLKVPSDVLLF